MKGNVFICFFHRVILCGMMILKRLGQFETAVEKRRGLDEHFNNFSRHDFLNSVETQTAGCLSSQSTNFSLSREQRVAAAGPKH